MVMALFNTAESILWFGGLGLLFSGMSLMTIGELYGYTSEEAEWRAFELYATVIMIGTGLTMGGCLATLQDELVRPYMERRAARRKNC